MYKNKFYHLLIWKSKNMEIILIGIILFIFFALWGGSKSNKCPDCKGSGKGPYDGVNHPGKCLTCNGIGRVLK
jgi:hypothetical protein